MSEGLVVGVVGNGGREAALAAVSDMSEQVSEVIGIGTNHGVDRLRKGRSINVASDDLPGIIDAVDELGINFLIVGPEKPIVLGVVDEVEDWAKANAREVAVLGPRKRAAIEGTKVGQRELWEELGLNGLKWAVFSGAKDIDRANEHIGEIGAENVVIKPDGFTNGHGVVLPEDQEHAEDTMSAMLRRQIYPEATRHVIVEERVSGPETSSTFISDGRGRRIKLPYSQDHKRLYDSTVEGRDNPNTGGMGAYAPLPHSILNYHHDLEISKGVRLAQERMSEEGRPVKGVWTEGDILTEDGVKRLEIGNRFGDPEGQALLWVMVHAGVDVTELLFSAARGRLSLVQADIPLNLGLSSVTLACTAEGYATSETTTGDEIFGIDKEYGDQVHIDLARALKREDGRYYTGGGRELFVTGVGKTVREAASAAYGAIGPDGIHWRGIHVRSTIAEQALHAA